MKPCKSIVHVHIRPNCFNTYGIRKDSATASIPEITMPSPMTSILRNGEWSMGIVLDTYFHFA